MRDEQEKKLRGYKDKRSRVAMDGSERLYGADWKKRKQELWDRENGRCQGVLTFAGESVARCTAQGDDPHHVIERSEHRDDRLENLALLCRDCHDKLDWKKLHWRESA